MTALLILVTSLTEYRPAVKPRVKLCSVGGQATVGAVVTDRCRQIRSRLMCPETTARRCRQQTTRAS